MCKLFCVILWICGCAVMAAAPERYIDPDSSGLELDRTGVSDFILTGEFTHKGQDACQYKLSIKLKRMQLSALKESGVRIYGLSPGLVSVISQFKMEVGDDVWEVPEKYLLGICNPKIPGTISIIRENKGTVLVTFEGADSAESYNCQLQFKPRQKIPLIVIKEWIGPGGYKKEEILLE